MKTTCAVDLTKRKSMQSAALLLASAFLGRPGTVLALSESTQRHLQEMPDRPWADPASLVSAIAAGTVAVPDVTETVAAYRQGFGYVVHWHGRVSAEMAEFWGVPAMADRAAAVVGPSEFKNGLIRFVELGEDFQQIPLHTTLGWTALEIRVRAVDDMVDQLASLPFVHTGGPSELKFGSGPPTLRTAQFQGPSGEPLYFMEDLRIDRSKLIGEHNVGGVFLQELAAVPYIQTRDFYLKTLAMQLRAQVDVRRANVAEALGIDEDRIYKMASVRTPQYCAIVVNEYPVETMPRPSVPGLFPPGTCMSTFLVQDLEPVADALRGVNISFTQVDSNSVPPWIGGRALACRGYSGEIVEFIEGGTG